MITLVTEKSWNGDYVFTVSNSFESKSITIPSYQVSDFALRQASQDVQFAFDLDDAVTKVKRACGIY